MLSGCSDDHRLCGTIQIGLVEDEEVTDPHEAHLLMSNHATRAPVNKQVLIPFKLLGTEQPISVI